jgi:hypothetical protein
MGDLVQNYVSLGRAVERSPVPIKAASRPLWMDRHAEGAGKRERCLAVPLRLRPHGAIGRGRTDAAKDSPREWVAQPAHESVESFVELVSGYRG